MRVNTYTYVHICIRLQTNQIHTQLPLRIESCISDGASFKSSVCIHMSSVRIHICAMGWLRLSGSFKLHDSFAEYILFNLTLLQKRRIISRSLIIDSLTSTSSLSHTHTHTHSLSLAHTHTYIYIETQHQHQAFRGRIPTHIRSEPFGLFL